MEPLSTRVDTAFRQLAVHIRTIFPQQSETTSGQLLASDGESANWITVDASEDFIATITEIIGDGGAFNDADTTEY